MAARTKKSPGHIRRRGGSWQAIVTLTDPDGKRRQVVKSAPTYEEARHHLILLLADRNKLAKIRKDETVGSLVDRFLRERETALKGTTLVAHRNARKRLAAVEDEPVAKLTRERLQSFLASLEGQFSQATIRRTWAVLSAALRHAGRGEVLTGIKVSTGRVRVSVPSTEQVTEFVSKAETHSVLVGVLARFMAKTGVRAAEACALRWDDVVIVSEDEAVVRIARTITLDSQGKYIEGTSTKTGKVRSIPLSDPLLIKGMQALGNDPYVFSHDGENFVRPDYVSKVFAKLWPEGSDWSPAHGLRHHYCSYLLNNGVPPATVMELTGHSSLASLMVYTHGIDEHAKAAAKLLTF